MAEKVTRYDGNIQQLSLRSGSGGGMGATARDVDLEQSESDSDTRITLLRRTEGNGGIMSIPCDM